MSEFILQLVLAIAMFIVTAIAGLLPIKVLNLFLCIN